MTSLPIITIAGATGQQGGSVLNALIATKQFKVRAIVRNTTSEAALALAAKDKNVELVQGDFDDPASLVTAFTGAFGAFLVSGAWNPFSGIPDTNFTQGKTLVDAAQAASVKFLVWSTMHDFDKLSNNEFPISGFTNKNKVEQYIKGLGISAAFVSLGMYMSNWSDVHFLGVPVKTKEGIVYETPFRSDVGIPVFNVDDLGQFVAPLFKDTKRYNGARVLASESYMTIEQMADAYTRATGESVSIVLKDPHTLPHPMITNVAIGVSRFGYYGGEPLRDSHRLYDELRLTTLEEWIRRTGFTAKSVE